VRSRLIEKARAGARWSAEEALEWIVSDQALRPGATPRTLEDQKDDAGRTSYDLLAARVPPDARVVVDLACGDGALGAAIARRLGAAVEIIGVDAGAADLELARDRLSGVRARLLCERAERTSLEAASADAVACHFAFMLMRPLEPVIAEIARILTPGGVFVACIPGLGARSLPAEASAFVIDVVRGDVPAYPDFGIGDPRVNDDAEVTRLLSAGGFREVAIATHVVCCVKRPTEVLADMRSYYWWDLLRDESHARLERELPAVLARHADATGRVRRESVLRLVEARRA
jgi:SAM-dependent methyltransferase